MPKGGMQFTEMPLQSAYWSEMISRLSHLCPSTSRAIEGVGQMQEFFANVTYLPSASAEQVTSQAMWPEISVTSKRD
jgi:2-keto-3-deoxy-6-phosphogluconate aldolase